MGEQSDQIRQGIEATRAQMGDTLKALSYKTDIAARVQDAVIERVDATYGLLGDAAAQATAAATSAGATVSGVAAGLGEQMRLSNPLAVTLAGLAALVAGGLFIARRRGV